MKQSSLEMYFARLEEVFLEMVRRFHSELAGQAVSGITGRQFFVLKIINDQGRVTVSEVANKFGVSLSAITALVDRLFKAGLVNRIRDDRDRRLVWLELTPEGKEILQKCQESRMRVAEKYFSQMPEGDIEKLVEIYERLLAVIKKDGSGVKGEN